MKAEKSMLATMNETSPLPPLAVKPEKTEPVDPKNEGGSPFTVAAPAISLCLVLAALVLWFFLMRVQLQRKEKRGYRLNSSKQSCSQDESIHEGHSGRHNGHKRSSSSSSRKLKGGSSGKKKRHSHHHCSCQPDEFTTPRCHSGACNCGLSSPQSSNGQVASNGISTVCTGNSPYCPHSSRMQHHVDIHSPGSSSIELGSSEYPLSETGGLFSGYTPRSRSNTADFIPRKTPRHTQGRAQGGSGDMILRGAGHGGCDVEGTESPGVMDPLLHSECSCQERHPLDWFEYKQCSCGLHGHTPEPVKRGRAPPSRALYFSAPSLVDKQLNSLC